MNELISSHEPANNEVMNTYEKTGQEISDLFLEYIEKTEALDEKDPKTIHQNQFPMQYYEVGII